MSANIRDQTITAIKNVRNLFSPAWYLPNGTINATEDQLENASSSCEQWAIWCGALVVVSVIAELVITAVHFPYDSPRQIWGTALTDFFVAVGIVGEVLFGMRNSRIQTELRRQSNKKLADAYSLGGGAFLTANEAKDAAESIDDCGTAMGMVANVPSEVAGLKDDVAKLTDDVAQLMAMIMDAKTSDK